MYTVSITTDIPGATPLRPCDFTVPFVGIMGSQSKRDLQDFIRGARAANARMQQVQA